MVLRSLFRFGTRARHATALVHRATTPVIVKRTNRDQTVDGLAFEPDAELAADIRAKLPNAPRAPHAPLRAALIARAFRSRLRAGRRLSDAEGTSLADAIEELSAFALTQGRVRSL